MARRLGVPPGAPAPGCGDLQSLNVEKGHATFGLKGKLPSEPSRKRCLQVSRDARPRRLEVAVGSRSAPGDPDGGGRAGSEGRTQRGGSGNQGTWQTPVWKLVSEEDEWQVPSAPFENRTFLSDQRGAGGKLARESS